VRDALKLLRPRATEQATGVLLRLKVPHAGEAQQADSKLVEVNLPAVIADFIIEEPH